MIANNIFAFTLVKGCAIFVMFEHIKLNLAVILFEVLFEKAKEQKVFQRVNDISL
jgi:hypothetical protein